MRRPWGQHVKPTTRILGSLREVSAASWDALAGGNPFVSHAFLCSLEDTGCVGERAGWIAQHITLEQEGRVCAAMPLYLKDNSYGEYIFDWSWAEAHHRVGAAYYPKLLCAVPFTPVTGPRLLADTPALRQQLLAEALGLARRTQCSSLHVLLPPPEQAPEFTHAGMLERASVQFHWSNPGYPDFEAFLAQLSHDKRKKIRQERRKVRDAGLSFRHLDGASATEEDWRFFTRCYNLTYRNHHSSPYLNLEFFLELAKRLPENLLLVLGSRDGQPVCAALNVHAQGCLYGRYWGTTQFHSGLHFETCYYQAMEFCIERALHRFEGGAQGEHKLARGFLPQRLVSAHWLAHPQFQDAVRRYLVREAQGIGRYVDELDEHTPFRADALEV